MAQASNFTQLCSITHIQGDSDVVAIGEGGQACEAQCLACANIDVETIYALACHSHGIDAQLLQVFEAGGEAGLCCIDAELNVVIDCKFEAARQQCAGLVVAQGHGCACGHVDGVEGDAAQAGKVTFKLCAVD